ncbi:Pc13g00150 [Penicillium rubens Wisconsin 54-1255]|uniref:Pc13g00150 protein n=1 Tax=Penicillium rubens (strain ATCC 28089 / DSM 1075 / NRRL 1951 / Wisconsin 54-1255) TaxID=500485 RepID=B6H5G4_PENRW|nr:Pc13g00150 [Penicillium rubens Wisconsin 54-1255]
MPPFILSKMPLKAVEHPSADDASSIYSRSPESPKDMLSSMPMMLPPRHDLPEINSLDHQIALARVIDVSQELTLQYHFEPEARPLDNERVFQAVRKLRVALEQSRIREAQAEQIWKRQWKVSRINHTTRWI